MLRTTIFAAVFTAGLAAAAGQQVFGALSAPRPAAESKVVREISDPATGDRWLLKRDLAEPGGPGRLVRVSASEDGPPQSADVKNRNERALPPRVIREGDQVVVQEHTAVMDAELEGVALNGARVGATLRVRLKIGGRIVSAVALEPGRVVIRPAMGARP